MTQHKWISHGEVRFHWWTKCPLFWLKFGCFCQEEWPVNFTHSLFLILFLFMTTVIWLPLLCEDLNGQIFTEQRQNIGLLYIQCCIRLVNKLVVSLPILVHNQSDGVLFVVRSSDQKLFLLRWNWTVASGATNSDHRVATETQLYFNGKSLSLHLKM